MVDSPANIPLQPGSAQISPHQQKGADALSEEFAGALVTASTTHAGQGASTPTHVTGSGRRLPGEDDNGNLGGDPVGPDEFAALGLAAQGLKEHALCRQQRNARYQTHPDGDENQAVTGRQGDAEEKPASCEGPIDAADTNTAVSTGQEESSRLPGNLDVWRIILQDYVNPSDLLSLSRVSKGVRAQIVNPDYGSRQITGMFINAQAANRKYNKVLKEYGKLIIRPNSSPGVIRNDLPLHQALDILKELRPYLPYLRSDAAESLRELNNQYGPMLDLLNLSLYDSARMLGAARAAFGVTATVAAGWPASGGATIAEDAFRALSMLGDSMQTSVEALAGNLLGITDPSSFAQGLRRYGAAALAIAGAASSAPTFVSAYESFAKKDFDAFGADIITGLFKLAFAYSMVQGFRQERRANANPLPAPGGQATPAQLMMLGALGVAVIFAMVAGE